MLITFSGVDCAGKSTQIERLQQALQARGRRCTTLWYRPGYSDLLNRLRRIVRTLRPAALPTIEQPQRRQQTFARPAVARTWAALALADLLGQYALKLRMMAAAGNVVIADRYLADAQLDLQFRFAAFAPQLQLAFAMAKRLCPRPDRAFLLTLPWQQVVERTARKAEPFPEPLELRRRRFDAYMDLAQSGDFQVIAAERSIDAIHQSIMAQLPPLR